MVGCCVLWLVVVVVICFNYFLLISSDIVCVRILCDFISYPVPVPITAIAFAATLIFLLPWLIVMFLLFCVSSFYSLSISSEIDCSNFGQQFHSVGDEGGAANAKAEG